MTTMDTVNVLCCIIVYLFVGVNSWNATTDDARIYDMKKCHGAGCPYTASWLNHINLYRKANWWLDSIKMEAASFSIFDAAPLKFQVSDPDAYFVHHMSMFEHLIHKSSGFESAKLKTNIMSMEAYKGECVYNLSISSTTEYIAFIPFYGGLPPNVTEDFSKVQSLGQGNSLVDASTKALQCMSTVCSCLKYFGHIVIGVARPQDLVLIESLLDKANPRIKEHVDLIHFRTNKPANLPFHLLAWGQAYMQNNNCKQGERKMLNVTDHSIEEGMITKNDTDHHNDTTISSNSSRRLFNRGLVAHTREESKNPYMICRDNVHKKHHGSAFEVLTHKPASHYKDIHDGSAGTKVSPLLTSPNLNDYQHTANYPLHFAYYSECDQILRFDSMETFHALSEASNDTTFFTGRRREKVVTSEPIEYMGSLDNYRNCGTPGYTIHWPRDSFVQGTS